MEEYGEEMAGTVENPEYDVGYICDIHQYVENNNNMQDPRRHMTLRHDLIEHIWNQFGHHA